MPEQKNNEGYFVVIRDTSGKYISRNYKNEKDFRDTELDNGELVIANGISEEAAEKKIRDFNDSHFPLPGLEKFFI